MKLDLDKYPRCCWNCGSFVAFDACCAKDSVASEGVWHRYSTTVASGACAEQTALERRLAWYSVTGADQNGTVEYLDRAGNFVEASLITALDGVCFWHGAQCLGEVVHFYRRQSTGQLRDAVLSARLATATRLAAAAREKKWK